MYIYIYIFKIYKKKIIYIYVFMYIYSKCKIATVLTVIVINGLLSFYINFGAKYKQFYYMYTSLPNNLLA